MFTSTPGAITAYDAIDETSSSISSTVPIIRPFGIVPLMPAVEIIEPYVTAVEESRFANLHLPSPASDASPVT